jgi:hypothetical protein
VKTTLTVYAHLMAALGALSTPTTKAVNVILLRASAQNLQ